MQKAQGRLNAGQKTQKAIYAALLVLLLSTGCASQQKQGNIAGNGRDAHGCIGSAGYAWCETKGKCLRSWEEACD